MGEIADDHMVEIYWNEGTGAGARFDIPGVDAPEFGGMNAFMQRCADESMRSRKNRYACKFCGETIGFIQRRAYNYSDGSLHKCLSDSNARAAVSRPTDAAAPELLSALVAAMHRLKEIEVTFDISVPYELSESARAAIAKATSP